MQPVLVPRGKSFASSFTEAYGKEREMGWRSSEAEKERSATEKRLHLTLAEQARDRESREDTAELQRELTRDLAEKRDGLKKIELEQGKDVADFVKTRFAVSMLLSARDNAQSVEEKDILNRQVYTQYNKLAQKDPNIVPIANVDEIPKSLNVAIEKTLSDYFNGDVTIDDPRMKNLIGYNNLVGKGESWSMIKAKQGLNSDDGKTRQRSADFIRQSGGKLTVEQEKMLTKSGRYTVEEQIQIAEARAETKATKYFAPENARSVGIENAKYNRLLGALKNKSSGKSMFGIETLLQDVASATKYLETEGYSTWANDPTVIQLLHEIFPKDVAWSSTTNAEFDNILNFGGK